MKILVVSLLRLGDLLMQKPLLQDLRRRRPGDEIHLLMNSSLASAADLLPEVDQFYLFERDLIQRALGTAEVPLLRPLMDLSTWIDAMNDIGFDEILNFTHNRVSSYVCDSLNAPVKRGLLAEGKGFRPLENGWLRHFNERYPAKGRSSFHYAEYLGRSFGLTPQAGECARGPFERIYLQLFTSDAKKNWALANWRELFDQLSAKYPSVQVQALVAPFEVSTARTAFAAEELAVLSLTEAARELDGGALLVSGDTSMVHLAAVGGSGIIQLALGSSSPDRTGPFASGAWMLESTVACAPCPARGACHQPSHRCEEEIPASKVAGLVADYMGGGLPTVGGGLRLSESRFNETQGWFLAGVGGEAAHDRLTQFEKAVTSLHLDEESGGGLPEVGSAARLLWESVAEEARGDAWLATVRVLRDQQERLEGHQREAIAGGDRLKSACTNLETAGEVVQGERRRLQSLFASSAEEENHLRSLRELGVSNAANPFSFFGVYRQRVGETGRRLDLRRRLIQQISEMGGFHEQTFGQLSESRVEAP